MTNDQFNVDGSRIRIPNLDWVRMRETLRFTGKMMSAPVSRVADRWFVSITVDTPDSSPLSKAENQGAVGVDLGVSALATLSMGERIAGSKAHKALLSRLQRLSRSLSRKVKGSENRKKAKLKLASRAVADMGFFEFRRQLDSKTCSDCGNKLETLPMSVREWVCPSCGVIHNREVNAVINLKNMAVSSTVSSCAEEGSGLGRKLKTKPASVKQESSAKLPMSNLSSG